jgi:hypothetical protein
MLGKFATTVSHALAVSWFQRGRHTHRGTSPLSEITLTRFLERASLSLFSHNPRSRDTGVAQKDGVNPIPMMNDPDEAMRLTACNPTGRIVPLLELPDLAVSWPLAIVVGVVSMVTVSSTFTS